MAFRLFSNILSPGEAVGLSLGAGAVRAVRLARTEAGFDLKDSTSVEFTAALPPHEVEIEAALLRVASLTGGERTRLVANVRARDSRLHFFDLPFDRADKVRQALPYIIEPLIMAPVEGLFFDYLPLTDKRRKGQPALAFAAEPEAVSSVIENLQAAGLNPNAVLPDSLGLVAAGQHFLQAEDRSRSWLLLDLGASQTGMVLFDQGRAIACRTTPYGGLDLTRKLAEAQNIDLSEAEASKRQTDLGDNKDSEPREILVRAWQPLLVEIERTLAASLAERRDQPPVLALAGGGANAPGLRQFLSGRLGLEVKLLNSEAGGAALPLGLTPELASAAGLAILGLSARSRPNLRQGELAPQQALSRYRASLAVMAGGLVLAGFFASGALLLDYRHQNQRYHAVKSEITRVFKEVSPETTRVVSPLAQLRQKVEQTRSGVTGLASEQRRVLGLILEVSRIARSREGLRILDLSLTPQNLELQGEGGSFEDIDRLKNELTRLPFFSEVTVGGARMDPVTRKLTFKLSLKRQTE
ncbi:MAG: pilus assembly protein PilM [Deltaproteobacteria bacterium]|nr:pilus assembly protein PilM [Deltaproteobacteria bacterium]MBW2086498.1 pilus assembly protein PilM [Deltaproteobacteria bacterium]